MKEDEIRAITQPLSFSLSLEATKKYYRWRAEQEKIAHDQQVATIKKKLEEDPEYALDFGESFILESPHPYYGAIGGGITFTICPTSIGDLIGVEHNYTKAKLDFYDDL